jgi:hypothetical protein
VRAGIVGIGLAAVVAGCGASPPATAPRPRDDVASVAFSSAKDEREGRTLFAARERLVRRCMIARGLSYPSAAPAPPTIPIADAPPSADGYGLSAQFAQAPSRRAAPSGAAYRRALLGSPRQTGTLHLPDGLVVRYRASGCYADAMATLYGSVRRYQLLVAQRNDVRNAAAEVLTSDPELARALAGWTRCMAVRGFRYPSPDAARENLYDAYLKGSDRARVRHRELATSAADRDCGQRTALYRTLARVQHDALRAMPSAERAVATSIARSRAAAVERARRIVSGQP